MIAFHHSFAYGLIQLYKICMSTEVSDGSILDVLPDFIKRLGHLLRQRTSQGRRKERKVKRSRGPS